MAMVWVEDMLACSGVANEGDANSVSLNSSAWDLPTCTPPAHPYHIPWCWMCCFGRYLDRGGFQKWPCFFLERNKNKIPPPTVRDNSGSWEIPAKKSQKKPSRFSILENGAGGANQKILNHHLKHSQAAAERGLHREPTEPWCLGNRNGEKPFTRDAREMLHGLVAPAPAWAGLQGRLRAAGWNRILWDGS